MDKRQITQAIENFAPLNLAEDWDCSGFLVDNQKLDDIKKVMLCLTVTDDIVNQAVSKGCEMIISHHPLFSVPIWYKDINIYCAHTNMDKTQGGTTDTLIKTIYPRPLREGKQLYEQNELQLQGWGNTQHEFLRMIRFAEPVDVETFIKQLRSISPNLRYVNNKNIKSVKRVAFCAGSGSEFIKDAKTFGADCYITGDLKFHTAVESEIMLVDLGHYESEKPVLKVFENLLKGKAEVLYAEEKSPFIY